MTSFISHADARSLATSDICHFFVGPDKEEFLVHSAVLSYHSPVLEKMIEGQFEEAVTRTITWDDIAVPTFISFWQVLYSGSYRDPTSADLTRVLANPTPDQLDANGLSETKSSVHEAVDLQEGLLLNKEKKSKKKATDKPHLVPSEQPRPSTYTFTFNNRLDAWAMFQGLGGSKTSPAGNAMGKINRMSSAATPKVASDGDVLVHHANVFILADRYDISTLMTVAHGKLHTALLQHEARLQFGGDGGPDVLILLRFCFGEPTPEKLRELVVLYAACKANELWDCDGFRELVEGSSEFAGSLVNYLVRMVH